MKPIATITLAMLFATQGLSMQNPEIVPDGVASTIFDFLFPQEIDALSKTCVRFRDFANEYNKVKHSHFFSLNMPQSHEAIFFSSGESFCMSYIDSGRPGLKTFDYPESKEQEISLVFDPHFAPHKTGIYFATRQMLNVLFGRREDVIHKVLYIDDHIILEKSPGSITVFNVKNRQFGPCFFQVNVVCCFEKHLFIFRADRISELIGYPNFSVREVKIGDLPVRAAVSSKECMITCHQDAAEGPVKFFKSSYLDKRTKYRLSSEMLKGLELPAKFSVRQLLLKGGILLVIAFPGAGPDWLLITYSIERDQVIRQQKSQMPISEAHLVDKNIFVVAKSSNSVEEDLFEVNTINIETLLK